jgi:integrase/recombinase XerD
MKDAISGYINRLRVLARSPQTIELFSLRLRKHAQWLTAHKIYDAKKVRLSHLEKYQHHLARKYHANTAHTITLLLQRFYRHLHAQGLIPGNPAQGLQSGRMTYSLPPNPPDAKTIYQVISSIDRSSPIGDRNRAILETLFSTALRREELLNLELGDIQMKDRTVLVRSGKGNKDRVALLSERAAKALADYIEQARPLLAQGLPGQEAWAEHSRSNGKSAAKTLWLAAHGGPLAQRSINRYFKLWSQELGRPFYPHLIRHAFAVHMLKRGADLRYVQALLGHESMDTTKIYLRLVKEDYKRAYDRAFPTLYLPWLRRKGH